MENSYLMKKQPPYLLPFTRSRIFGAFVDNQLLLDLITYGQHRIIGERVVKELNILKSLGQRVKVLQIGFAPGSLSVKIAHILENSGELAILDPLPFQLERAKKKLSNFGSVHYFEGIGEDVPFPDASFDAIILFFLFHEIPSDVRANIMKKALRLIHKGGAVIVCDFAKPTCMLGKVLVFFFSLFGEKYLPSFLKEGIPSNKGRIAAQESYLCNTFQFSIVKITS